MTDELAGRGYLDHLTDSDLGLLADAAGAAMQVEQLRRRPALVAELLGRRQVFDAVFTADRGRELVGVSPLLTFAVAVHRAAGELGKASHVPERSGVRQRIPVFDVDQLRDFLADPLRRLFLAELLASYARVASGRYWTRTARGWRSRRYSELDPVRLAALVTTVPATERPGLYRRLGDLALFLTGVFPDHAQLGMLGPLDAARLLRAAGVPPAEGDELVTAPPIRLLEHLGQRWYRQAYALAPVRSARLAVVGDVADRFRPARRVLNHVTDRYLFPAGNPWFSAPAG